MNRLCIAHLYPAHMNIYGDRGNITVLKKRLEWRDFHVHVDEVHPGDDYDFRKADIVFGGGGQDQGQALVAEDLRRHKDNLAQAASEGVVMLVICGTYQLFGRQFVTQAGESIAGIGVFDLETRGSTHRLIGNVVVSTQWGEIVGFENHSGQTKLEPGQAELGRVIKGHGNNMHDKHEGAVTKNVFGTYLHGPLLPKNPHLADELIQRAVTRKYHRHQLPALNDTLEHEAASVAKQRPN
jgi:lipid II isoglutaminyl synthase (glutamine-hydrolysing)